MKIAAVTGATSGIGAATVRLLVGKHVPTVATGRRVERLAALESELNGGHRNVVGVPADVNEPGLVAKLFSAATRNFGKPPNVLVLCAGRGLPGTVLTSNSEAWESLIETGYLSVLRQLRDCVTHWMQDPASAPVRDLVVIGSTIGRQVSAFNPVYGATKFALHSVVEALRQEVCQRGIRVTLIEPGWVKSEFQTVAGYDMKWFESVEAECGPLLSPRDVAEMIDFIVNRPAHVHVDDIRMRPTRQRI
jgi:NADP-dependent 3-hydroxy acid dehydrogenase YdfG